MALPGEHTILDFEQISDLPRMIRDIVIRGYINERVRQYYLTEDPRFRPSNEELLEVVFTSEGDTTQLAMLVERISDILDGRESAIESVETGLYLDMVGEAWDSLGCALEPYPFGNRDSAVEYMTRVLSGQNGVKSRCMSTKTVFEATFRIVRGELNGLIHGWGVEENLGQFLVPILWKLDEDFDEWWAFYYDFGDDEKGGSLKEFIARVATYLYRQGYRKDKIFIDRLHTYLPPIPKIEEEKVTAIRSKDRLIDYIYDEFDGGYNLFFHRVKEEMKG